MSDKRAEELFEASPNGIVTAAEVTGRRNAPQRITGACQKRKDSLFWSRAIYPKQRMGG